MGWVTKMYYTIFSLHLIKDRSFRYQIATLRITIEQSECNGELSEPFRVETDVRQGCLLSPILFLLAVDWIMKTTDEQGCSLTQNLGAGERGGGYLHSLSDASYGPVEKSSTHPSVSSIPPT